MYRRLIRKSAFGPNAKNTWVQQTTCGTGSGTICTGSPHQPSRLAGRRLQQAREQGLSLRAIARKLGMDRNTVGKYALAETPPTKKLSAKERAKAEAQAGSPTSAD